MLTARQARSADGAAQRRSSVVKTLGAILTLTIITILWTIDLSIAAKNDSQAYSARPISQALIIGDTRYEPVDDDPDGNSAYFERRRGSRADALLDPTGLPSHDERVAHGR
jgi:hypothetical protein